MSIQVWATGVLMDPHWSHSCSMEPDTTLNDLLHKLRENLTTKYNEFIRPSSPIELTAANIFMCSTRAETRNQPISTLSGSQSDQTYTVVFQLPETHTLQTILADRDMDNEQKLTTTKLELADTKSQLAGHLLVQEEDNAQKQTLSKSSRRTKKRSAARQPAMDNHASSQKTMGDELREVMDRLNLQAQEIKDLQASKTVQADEIQHQADEIQCHTSQIKKQAGEIKLLKAANVEKSVLNKEMSAKLQYHSTALHALHRRVVLDDARIIISNRYAFALSELQTGSHGRSVEELVRDVSSKLNQADAVLLHNDALTMIFDSKHGTVRFQGNVAAHKASKEDMSSAIAFGQELTELQMTSLKNIYRFAHHEFPKY
ncbi:hypothetical protein EDB19DRAFT_1917769 [Suillus lakei]|nr:hypothetical protein EDB19DRAFT_1917769 [Suillus lakei]